MHTIDKRFSLILKYMGIQANEINLETSFVKDLEFEEFQFGYLIYYLESYFRIKIKESDYSELDTIDSAKEYVRRKVKKGNHLKLSRRNIRPVETLKSIPWNISRPVKARNQPNYETEDYFFHSNLRWAV